MIDPTMLEIMFIAMLYIGFPVGLIVLCICYTFDSRKHRKAEQAYMELEERDKGNLKFTLDEVLERRIKISKSHIWSLAYAGCIAKGKFELGERIMAKDGETAYKYSKLIDDRFKLGEKKIKRSIYKFLYEKKFNITL